MSSQMINQLGVVELILTVLNLAEAFTEDALEDLSDGRLDHGWVLHTVSLLEELKHWHKQVLINDHLDVR